MSDTPLDDQEQDNPETHEEENLTFAAWVHATLRLIEAPASQGKSFCPQWWLHPEAVARFKALYVQYLKAREEGEISGWWVYHWDAHARALMDPATGVFRDCAGGHLEGLDSRVREVIADETEDPGFIDLLQDNDPHWV